MKYEIQWFSLGRGQIGWTPDGIGEDNTFDTRESAEIVVQECIAADRQEGITELYRVVPIVEGEPTK